MSQRRQIPGLGSAFFIVLNKIQVFVTNFGLGRVLITA